MPFQVGEKVTLAYETIRDGIGQMDQTGRVLEFIQPTKPFEVGFRFSFISYFMKSTFTIDPPDEGIFP
jgi:hypothetical protein